MTPKTPVKGGNQSKDLLGNTTNSSTTLIGGTAQKSRPIKLIQRIHKSLNDECAAPNQAPQSSQATKKLSVVKLIRPPTAQQKLANENPILSVSPRGVPRSDNRNTQRQASVPASIKLREQS